MKKLTKVVLLIFLLWTTDYGLLIKCGMTSSAYAAIPHLINYQGRLTDSSGIPLNGSYNLTFKIYDAETAGNLLWEETHSPQELIDFWDKHKEDLPPEWPFR